MRSLGIIVALAVFLAGTATHDTLRLTPVERLSLRYHYDVLAWEVTHVPAKWLYLGGRLAFPFRQDPGHLESTVREYFRLRQEAERTGATRSPDLSERDRRLRALHPWVEETLEAAMTDALRQERIPLSIGKVAFPPVDFAMDPLPTLLVTSPRNRIGRLADVLLVPRLPVPQREALEERIVRQENLSALVEGIGGISTYPTIVHSDDLRSVLVAGSHEWLHNYLFFKPLGQGYKRDQEMSSLNETTANLFAEELADLAYARLTGEAPPSRSPGASEPCPEDRFCFQREMRQTRLRAEELLAQGQIEEAEAYMEERRRTFVANGHALRKINQAYFAFHGTYADSPASVSPVYQQLLEVRQAFPSLGAFIHAVEGIASYREFTALLQRLRPGSGA